MPRQPLIREFRPAKLNRMFIEMMRKKGFTDQDLDVMTRKNPARLLGLPEAR